MRQSVQLLPFWYSSPGLHMQLLWVAEPSSAVLPFGQGLHASEVSEKLSLKVSSGHFVQFAPVPVLSCSYTGLEKINERLQVPSNCENAHLSQPGHQPGMQVQSLSGANFSGETCKDVSWRS